MKKFTESEHYDDEKNKECKMDENFDDDQFVEDVVEEINEYKWIESTLRSMSDLHINEVEIYESNFRRHKLTDNKLHLIEEKMWRDIIPEFGVQLLFKKRMKERINDHEN